MSGQQLPYYVPAGYGEAETVEKRSRFTGRVWPVESEEQALEKIAQMREEYWDATHNVYAYIIKESGIARFSDDGEPHGTSGKPTLDVFSTARVTNVCCVVTRYFGGVLLGTGGLVRAYSQTAKAALESAGICAVRLWSRITVNCPYNLFERVKAELSAAGGSLEQADYAHDINMEVLVPEEAAGAFAARLAEISAGRLACRIEGSAYMAGRV